MSDDSGEEKNLPATDHHLEKLRQKGNIPLSDDFHAAAASATKVLVLYFGATMIGSLMMSLLEAPFQMSVSSHSIAALAKDSLFLFIVVFFTVSGLSIAAYIFARGIDGRGIKPHFEQISFKLSNLNPVTGIKNKFKVRGLFELFKGIVKVFILGVAFVYIVWPHVGSIVNSAGCGLNCSGPLVADLVWKMVLVFLVLQIAAAILDIKLVRDVFKSENKMSHSDQKRENRDMDGDPDIKSEQNSFRNTLLESSDQNATQTARIGLAPASHAVPTEEDERRIVVFSGGRAMTISVNFSGEFKPILLDIFDYRGDAPPKNTDKISVEDAECVRYLGNLTPGQQIPFHVMKRMLDVVSNHGNT